MSSTTMYIGKDGKRGEYKKDWRFTPLNIAIIDALNARNMSIADLARAIGAPGSSVISRWMQGARPSIESLQAIADALGLDVFDLLYKAEYVNRLPSNGITDDPAKMELIQKIVEVDLSQERRNMLNALLDTMLVQTPREARYPR